MIESLSERLASLPPEAIYAVLFGLFLFQVGFLIGPVVPGNPLLFAFGVASVPGAAGALPLLNPWIIALVTGLGVFAGNLINYAQGAKAGPAFRRRGKYVQSIENAERFFSRHGSRTVVLAAFLPFIRAFVPFVAGMGRMDLRRFVISSLIGGLAWCGSWTALGHTLGQVPVVRDNANRVVIGIVVVVAVVAIAKSISMRRAAHTR